MNPLLFNASSLRRLLIINSMGNQSNEYTATGNPATFTTNVAKDLRQLLIPFSPVQDLHGQSNPYPAGGGKNKLTYPMYFNTDTRNGCTATVATDGTVTFSGTPSADTTWNIKLRTETSGNGSMFLPEGEYVLNGCPAGGSATTYQISAISSSGTSLGVDRGNGATFSVPSGGMNIGVQLFVKGSYNPNSLKMSPMIRLSSVSDAAFAPYSNICPITGYSGVNVTRTGTNLAPRFLNETKTLHGLELVPNNDGSIRITGKPTNGSTTRNLNRITLPNGAFPIKAGNTYTFYKGSGASIIFAQVVLYSGAIFYSQESKNTKTPTVDTSIRFLDIGINANDGTAIDVTLYPQFELGDTASAYEPYSGTTVPVVFPAMWNLLNYADYSSSYLITSITNNGDGSFTVVASEKGAYIDHVIDVEPGETYCIKAENATNDSGNASQIGVAIIYDGQTDSSPVLLDNKSIVSTKTFVPTGSKILVRNKVTGGSGAGTGTIVKPQLEKGSVPTAYVPYSDSTTAYGGTLDATTGTLTVTEKMRMASSLTWTNNTAFSNTFNGNGFTDRDPTIDASNENGCFCDSYKWYTSLNIGGADYGIALANNSGRTTPIFVRDIRYSSATDFVNSLAQNDVMIVLPLFTPLVFHLDPVSIQTLIGDNVIFSDTNGENVIKYLKKG